jgi:hypothetical protein
VGLSPKPLSKASEALFAAVRADDRAALARALADGADINGEQTYEFAIDRTLYEGSYTPLRLAADLEKTALVGHLLSIRGIEVDRGDCFAGETPLMSAARHGCREIVEMLLAAGADPNCEEKYERCCAASFAIRGNHEAVARRLMEAGTDLKRFGYKLYAEATNFRMHDLVALITAEGVPPEPPMTTEQRAALAYAASMAAANYADYEPPEMMSDAELFRAAEEGNARKLQEAVAHGMRVNRRRDGGDTPLMAATRAGQSQAAMILIQGGADLRLQNDAGEDALSLAEKLGRSYIAAALRRRLRDSAQR